MTEPSSLPRLPGPGPARAPTPGQTAGAGLLAFLGVVAGSVLLGLAGGLLWSHLAPRVRYVVLGHGTAQVVNPETSAFIAADGWFCVMAVAGGMTTGLLGYLLAVRRYGPLPMAGVLGGGLAAAYAAMKIGQQNGRAHFYSLLASSRRGALLQGPVSLGSHEALVFWPLAAGLVAGGFEAVVLLRLRSRARRGVRPAGHHSHRRTAAPGRDWPAQPGISEPGPRAGEPGPPAEPPWPAESPWPGDSA